MVLLKDARQCRNRCDRTAPEHERPLHEVRLHVAQLLEDGVESFIDPLEAAIDLFKALEHFAPELMKLLASTGVVGPDLVEDGHKFRSGIRSKRNSQMRREFSGSSHGAGA